MRKDGLATREKILDSAGQLIMESGYGGTTVDEVIERSSITKGAFFHHFKSKEDLAHALVARYAENDIRLLDDIIKMSEERSTDPVHQLLGVVDIYIEFLEKDPHPQGCMYAAYCYESGLLSAPTLQPIQNALYHWRKRITEKIEAAARKRPIRSDVNVPDLADCFLSTFEGGFVLARTLNDPPIIVRQLRQFRHYLAALFGA